MQYMTTYNKGDIVIIPFPKRFSFTGKCLNRIFGFEKDELIDEIVYKLYGLTEEEINIL